MITIGGAGGVVESIGTTILTTSNGSNRMLYTSQFFYALGAFFAPVIVGFLLNLGVGIPNIGRVVGIFSFVLGTVVWLLVYQPWVGQDEDPQHKEGKIGSDLEEDNILSHVEVPVENKMISIGPGSNSPGLATFAFPFLFLTMISYVIIESAVGNWFAVYINEALAFSRADASFILSFYWVGLGVSRMFYMVIIIKNQSKTLLFQMGIMLMAVLLLLYSDMITNLSFLMVAVFILGFGCGPIWPLLIEYCSYLFAQEHLLMYLVGAGSIGALFGPIITSILFSIIGLERMNVLIFAYVLGMLLTTIVTIRIIKYNQSKING
jgi:fucose permease